MSDKKNKKYCEKYAEYISAYLDDELTATELLELSGHLKSCAGCSRDMEKLSAVKNALHQADPFWPKPKPSDKFLSNLKESLHREAHPGIPSWRRRARKIIPFRVSTRLTSLAAASVVVILLLAGALVYLQTRTQTMVASTEEEDTSLVTSYTVAEADNEYDLEEYLSDHALGSSQNLLVDYGDQVEFVGYDQP